MNTALARWIRPLFAAALLLTAAGCQRKEVRVVERLAILPLENLSADPSLDWAGAAISGILAEQVSASTKVFPFQVHDIGSARVEDAGRVVEGYVTRSGGKLRIHAVIEDLATNRITKTLDAESGIDSGVTAAAESMAKSIDGRTRRFGTENATAIRAWGESIVTDDAEAKRQALERAIAADPNFGRAYTDLTALCLAKGDPACAAEVLKKADDRLSGFTDLERARLEFVESGVRNNPAQRREALVALSRLVSTDLGTVRTLAELEINGRRFGAAIDLFKNALAMDPDNPTLLNELGYAQAYNGNLEGAREALERYRDLRPGDSNSLDSLGEVHFYAGRFGEAEKYFLEGQKMSPGFQGGVELLKAAQARFLQGNLNGADDLISQYEQLRRNDVLSPIRRAEWLYMTGRKPQAIAAAMGVSEGPNPELSAYAFCHLSLWAMDSGDKAKAADYASRSARAQSPAMRRLAALCIGITSGSAPDSAVADLAQAYAAVFAKDGSRAASLFDPLYKRSGPAVDGALRTMYAWSLMEAGQRGQARSLLADYFIPLGTQDEPMLSSHAFPHFLELRAALVGRPQS